MKYSIATHLALSLIVAFASVTQAQTTNQSSTKKIAVAEMTRRIKNHELTREEMQASLKELSQSLGQLKINIEAAKQAQPHSNHIVIRSVAITVAGLGVLGFLAGASGPTSVHRNPKLAAVSSLVAVASAVAAAANEDFYLKSGDVPRIQNEIDITLDLINKLNQAIENSK